MAGFRIYCFAIWAVFGALSMLQNDFAAAIRIEPGSTMSPDMNDSRSQSKRSPFSWRRLAGPIQRAMSSLRGLFTRRSRAEAIKELETIEEFASKYIDCLNLGPSGEKSLKAATEICGKLGSEALERTCSLFSLLIADALMAAQKCISYTSGRSPNAKLQCFKKKRLFLVHPLLHESTSDASGDDYSNPQAWYAKLRFDPQPNKDLSPLGSDPLTLAFHRVNQGVMGTVDTHYMVGSKMLFQSTVAKGGLRKRLSGLWRRIRRRGDMPREPVQRIPEAEEVVDQGRELFEGLPPHPDPLSVRLAVFMLLDGVSCPASLSTKRYETVLLNGKPKKVKLQKIIETTVLLVIERLFNARDCLIEADKADETTCRLLRDYDQYRQSGGKRKGGSSGGPSALQRGLIEPQDEQGEALEGAEGEVKEQGLESVDDLRALESIDSGDESSQRNQAFAEMPAGDFSGRDNESHRRFRMLRYIMAGTNNAVAMARMGMQSERVVFRVVQILLGSKTFRKLATGLLMRFAGEDLFSIDAMAALASYGRRGKLLFGIYVQSMVQLATGSVKLGKVSGGVVGAVAQEASQLARANEQQPSEQQPAALLQESIPRIPTTQMRGMLKGLGIEVKQEQARKIAGGLTIGIDLLLVFTLVTVGVVAGPILFAVAAIAGLLILFHAALVVKDILRPRSVKEKARDKWQDMIDKMKTSAERLAAGI
ncbi:hypothetical protein Efla_004374 [Eimeria flavescens]